MKSINIVLLFYFASVKADDSDCGVIPMTEWAGEPSLRKDPLPNPVNLVIIQHTATPEATSDDDCVNALKLIRKKHIETLHFDDIGESFLVCENGKVYEGAGWGLVGAHTKTYNSKSIGISFIGNFQSHLPNADAITAAQNLIACGVANNHLTSDYKLVGHRQLRPTISPGDALQNEIQTWPQWDSTGTL